jgi:hypothetical protein
MLQTFHSLWRFYYCSLRQHELFSVQDLSVPLSSSHMLSFSFLPQRFCSPPYRLPLSTVHPEETVIDINPLHNLLHIPAIATTIDLISQR